MKSRSSRRGRRPRRNPTDRTAQIARLVTDEEMVLEGDEFWVVLIVGDGTYLAACVDEDGVLHTAIRKTRSGAIKLASNSWGR
jgi:hypothetical protein